MIFGENCRHRHHWRCGLKCLSLDTLYFTFWHRHHWRCGLKYPRCTLQLFPPKASPSLAMWIEMSFYPIDRLPFKRHRHHWRCGLKFRSSLPGRRQTKASPSLEMWIEIHSATTHEPTILRHRHHWRCGLKSGRRSGSAG